MAFFGKGGGGTDLDTDPMVDPFAILAEVRAYWEGLRHGTDLPRRDEVDPRGIARALENTFLLERVAPGIARFRIAGMQLHDLMGMDVRGMPLSALIEPQGRNRLAEALNGVFSGPGRLEVRLEAERGIGRPALEGRMVILPLTGAHGAVHLAMGCLAMHGAVGRTPRRFAISAILAERIDRQVATSAQRDDQPVARPKALAPVLAGLAEAGADFTAAVPRPPRGKPTLRLVHSRD